EGIFDLPTATGSVQASGETSTGIQPAASVPADTAPATDDQPTASVLAHTDISIGTDGAGLQAVVPAANTPSSSQSVRAIVRQHMPEGSLRAIAEKVLHTTRRYGIHKPVTSLLAVLEELAARLGRLTVRIVTSPGLVLSFAVFGLGLVVWRYKSGIALSLFRTGFGFVDRSILVPVCEYTQNSAVDVCYPMCKVAGSLEFPVLACGNQPSWAIASETLPALMSEQVMFSKLAASDIVTRFQGLGIRLDNSTNEVLDYSGKIYEELGSDIAQYSREAESLFQLFTISEDRVNRTFQMGEFEEAKRWYDNILALLPTLAKGKAEESALNAHTNIVLPRLGELLATGERIDEKISLLQSQEAQSVSQLRSVGQTIQLLHPRASRIRSFLDYLQGVAAGRGQTTGQYVKALIAGYQKVIDASENTARSFKESFSQLQALDSALKYHNTWQGTPQDKPRKVYLAQMRSAFQQAKNALQSWAYEDKRHGDFLFDSLEDRLASLFQVYAWEEMH
ncbi:MAG: hypothetical protein Q9193_006633, partial [Seirophora villosa]